MWMLQLLNKIKKIKKCCRQKPSSHKKNKKKRTFCSCCKFTQNPAARRFHRFSYQRLLSKKKKKERKVVKQSFYLQLFWVLVRVAVRFRVCWIVRRVRDVKVFIGGRPGHVLYVQGGWGCTHKACQCAWEAHGPLQPRAEWARPLCAHVSLLQKELIYCSSPLL